jgi:hypothetical protein
MECPFCKQDPYHYEDVGVGYVPVAITCCDAMVPFGGEKRRLNSYSGFSKACHLESSEEPKNCAHTTAYNTNINDNLLLLYYGGRYG